MQYLITANMKVPDVLRDTLEILRLVDVNSLVFLNVRWMPAGNLIVAFNVKIPS